MQHLGVIALLQPAALAAGITLLTANLCAAAQGIGQLLDDLTTAKSGFVKEQEAAKQLVVSRFDVLIQAVIDHPRLKAAERLARADILRSERQAFAARGVLPENTGVLHLGWQYATTVARKYHPVSQAFDRVMSTYIQNGQLDLAQRVRADQEQFDGARLAGRGQLVGGSVYAGSRHQGTSAILFQLHVKHVAGSVFKARVTQSSGTTIFDIDGTIDGLCVKFNHATAVKGQVHLARCEGVLLGDTLILQLTTMPAARQPATVSIAVLRR
jgi:hypothetical protein